VDARTDVYSLTCVLFTCLTGRAPYVGSVGEVIDGHLGGEVPSAAELAGLDPRIDDVVHRGMDPDRPRRHESASAVIEAARGALTGPGPAPLVGPAPGRRGTGPPSGPLRPPIPPGPASGGDGADRAAARNGAAPVGPRRSARLAPDPAARRPPRRAADRPAPGARRGRRARRDLRALRHPDP